MKHVLWLASWYPSEPFWANGDFVQRHARAVAGQMRLTVIHVPQHGHDYGWEDHEMKKITTGQLTEITVPWKYRPMGLGILDKIRYNATYFHIYKKFLRKYIAENGNPDLVHVHIPMKAGRLALWLKAKFNIPYIVTEHSSAYFDEVQDSYHKRSAYYRKWVKKIFEEAEAVTTVSKKIGNRLSELFDIKKMVIIPNVVDTSHFYYAADDRTDHQPFRVKDEAPLRFRFIHASTLIHPKNIDGILRAFHKLKDIRKDWECLLIGANDLDVREAVKRMDLHYHIKVYSEIPYEYVAGEMQRASALVMFSFYENQPCVILEALCCGLPVVSSSVGGIPEIVDQSNGMLVPPKNEELLTQALVKCMDEYDRFNRPAIAQEAQSRYSYEVIGKMFVDLYTNSSASLPTAHIPS